MFNVQEEGRRVSSALTRNTASIRANLFNPFHPSSIVSGFCLPRAEDAFCALATGLASRRNARNASVANSRFPVLLQEVGPS